MLPVSTSAGFPRETYLKPIQKASKAYGTFQRHQNRGDAIVTRRDYLNDPDAPRPNSIAVACSAYIEDDFGRVLLIRRSDNGYYSIPGGQTEPGEALTETVVREVREETGMMVRVTGLIGIFSNPNHVIKYDNGEIRQEFSICFRAECVDGDELRTSDESPEVRWVPKDELDALNIHPSTALRIEIAQTRADVFYT